MPLTRYRVITLMVLALCVSCPSWALSPGDNLLTPQPKGWKIGHTNAQKGVSQIMEMVPEGQTVENWNRMITVQIFYTLRNVEPSQFANKMGSSFRQACPKTEVRRVPQDRINGRPTARFYFHNPECGRRAAESLLMLVLQGNDALHVIQYAWRPAPPTEKELQEANAYLNRIRFCDTRKGDCEDQMNRMGEEGRRSVG